LGEDWESLFNGVDLFLILLLYRSTCLMLGCVLNDTFRTKMLRKQVMGNWNSNDLSQEEIPCLPFVVTGLIFPVHELLETADYLSTVP
jgi:hypothetical protein